ncbi:MAG: acetyl-CoA carboxylase biotin carboxyl carrier protein subunit [Syntrophaceae bacterium]
MMEEILAPMAGKVIRILVNAGDSVREDDHLLVLDAMKMENPILATFDGVVKEIKVKADDEVEADDPLVIIEQA